MQNNNSIWIIICCISSFLLITCARNTAQRGWLDKPLETKPEYGFGGWIEVWDQTNSDKQAAQGELIAVGVDSLYLFNADELTAIAFNKISKAQLTGYNSGWSSLMGWTFFGTLSTLSHGAVLIISAPVWIIAGTATTASQSKKPVLRFPEKPWAEFRKYARFPQGLPEGMDRGLLKPKQFTPKKKSYLFGSEKERQL